jgi:hypothetical protein
MYKGNLFTKEKIKEDVLRISNIHPLRVFNIVLFGSRVYVTDTKGSDYDIKIVANGTRSNVEIRNGLYNIHIITPPDFQNLLNLHHPGALECYFAPDFARIHETTEWDFKLKPAALRHYYSRVSSNSWVKCKKKLEGNEYYIGIKSLFHSIRIPMFGYQIATQGRITDFSCANDINNELFSRHDWTWDELDDTFRNRRLQAMTDLRSVTTK